MATDILTLLREYCIGNRKMRYINYNNETYAAFDEYAFPKNADTPLAVYGKQGEYYNLESLIYLWNHKDLVHTTYVKDTALKGIGVVTRSDRRAILDYLKGVTNELPTTYDSSFPPRAPIPTSRLRDETTTEPERKKQKLEPQAEKSQRLDSILSGEPSDSKQIRSLNENLDADKINLLRKKKLLNQKNKIADVGDNVDMLAVAAAAPEKEVRMEKERVWRTRANCMDSMIKDFTNVFDILKTLQKKEDGTGGPEKPAPAPVPKIPTKTAKAVPGYSRYDQEIFTKDTGADFNIDTEVSFVGQSINNLKSKPTPIPTSAPPKPAPSSHHPHPQSAAKPNEPPAPRRRTNRTPIIIIPGGMAGTLINMYNVRDVLQDMTFKTPEEKKGAGQKRETECQLHRKRGEVTVPYRVIENPLRLTDEEWDRVVAIFVMGPTWQFKGWKWQGNPVEIFSHIPAFHLHYDDLKIDKNVAQWSVTFIPISRTKRHLDKARLAKFWDTLDRHIVKHKSHLRH